MYVFRVVTSQVSSYCHLVFASYYIFIQIRIFMKELNTGITILWSKDTFFDMISLHRLQPRSYVTHPCGVVPTVLWYSPLLHKPW